MKTPVADRFFDKVAVTGPDDCWLWTAYKTKEGYGHITDENGDQVLAHRVSWEIVNGPIPLGMHVLHTCDTPSCVNARHLFLGNDAINVMDRCTKGRTSRVSRNRGERNGSSKLSDEQVHEIRALALPLKDIAEMYHVGVSCISQIKNNRRRNVNV